MSPPCAVMDVQWYDVMQLKEGLNSSLFPPPAVGRAYLFAVSGIPADALPLYVNDYEEAKN